MKAKMIFEVDFDAFDLEELIVQLRENKETKLLPVLEELDNFYGEWKLVVNYKVE